MRGRYLAVNTDVVSWDTMAAIWSRATGADAVFEACDRTKFAQENGSPGYEYATQLAFAETVDDWRVGLESEFVAPEELGIREKDLMGLEATLSAMRDLLLAREA